MTDTNKLETVFFPIVTRHIHEATVVNGFIDTIIRDSYVSTEESSNGSGEEGGLVINYDGGLTKASLRVLRRACLKRLSYLKPLLEQIPGYKSNYDIGYNIFHTCSGSGVGFWSEDLGELGDLITEVIKEERAMWLEVMIFPSRKKKYLIAEISG